MWCFVFLALIVLIDYRFQRSSDRQSIPFPGSLNMHYCSGRIEPFVRPPGFEASCAQAWRGVSARLIQLRSYRLHLHREWVGRQEPMKGSKVISFVTN